MKTNLFFVCLVCIFISTTAKQRLKNRQKTPKPKKPVMYYINNWSSYKMPEEIDAEQLKKIMENVAGFKRLELCPFGKLHRCQSKSVKKKVQKVIENILLNKLHGEGDDSVEENKNNDFSKEELSHAAKPSNSNTADSTTTNHNLDGATTVSTSVNDGNANVDDAGSETVSGDSASPADTDDANGETAGDDTDGDAAASDDPAPSDDAGDGDAAAGDDAALRVKKYQHLRKNTNAPKKHGNIDLNGNLVNVVKVINFGKNVQYFTDNNSKSKDEKKNVDKKYFTQMLNLFVKILNFKKTKLDLKLPKNALVWKDSTI